MTRTLRFNLFIFLALAVQYSLLHILPSGTELIVSAVELGFFLGYTVLMAGGIVYKSVRVNRAKVSGLAALFFSVLWAVALASHFQKESYTSELTLICTVGISTAVLILLTEFIILCRA